MQFWHVENMTFWNRLFSTVAPKSRQCDPLFVVLWSIIVPIYANPFVFTFKARPETISLLFSFMPLCIVGSHISESLPSAFSKCLWFFDQAIWSVCSCSYVRRGYSNQKQINKSVKSINRDLKGVGWGWSHASLQFFHTKLRKQFLHRLHFVHFHAETGKWAFPILPLWKI